MFNYTFQFTVIGVLYRKDIISVNISSNNFTLNFTLDIAVKLSAWFSS